MENSAIVLSGSITSSTKYYLEQSGLSLSAKISTDEILKIPVIDPQVARPVSNKTRLIVIGPCIRCVALYQGTSDEEVS